MLEVNQDFLTFPYRNDIPISPTSNQKCETDQQSFWAPPWVCHVCKEATRGGNDAVNESLDNFKRYYCRLRPEKDAVPASADETARKQPYRYNPLADEHSTRLLSLEPGQGKEMIRCSVQEMDIDDPPKYKALSYTWGMPEGRLTIDVEGHDFLVTSNLWNALWHLRRKDHPVIIWIDAICINQDDIDERNHIVRRMKDIYERADHIIAWLGPENQNSGSVALFTVANIYEHYTRLIDKLGTQEAAFKHMLDHKSWAGEEHAQAAYQQWWAVNQLFNRTWFHRIWIVQEGSTPTPTTFQICHYTVPLEAVYEVFRLLQSVPKNSFPRSVVKDTWHDQRMEALTVLAERRRQQHSQSRRNRSGRSGKTVVREQTLGLPLLEVLHLVRQHSATDQHDKIYAALVFAAEEYTLPIEIDYRKPLSEMLRDVAVSCFHHDTHYLRFLGYAGLMASGHLLATWMPDWLYIGEATPFPKETAHSPLSQTRTLYNACNADHPIWNDSMYRDIHASIDGNTLKVPGIIVDYVHTLSVVYGLPENIDTLESAWTILNADHNYTVTGETRGTAYLRTLVADLKMKNGKVIGRGGSMYKQKGGYKPPNHDDIDEAFANTCIFRKFIQTQKHKYFGIGSAFALQGDAIFMLKGGEMLYVARPTVDGTYHYVGEAYIHGMMDGAVVDNYNRGQGKLQMAEFVPVTNEVLDSTKSTQGTTMVNGVRVKHEIKNVALNVRLVQLKNPKDATEHILHNHVGPRAEDFFLDIMTATTEHFTRQGLSRMDALKRAIFDAGWATAAEEALLKEYPFVERGGSSKSNLAGRDYARRSYFRAAIAQGKAQIAAMLIGAGHNMLPNGEILACEGYYEEVSEGDRAGNVNDQTPSQTAKEQTAADELLARKLQEEEYAGLPDGNNATSNMTAESTWNSKSPYSKLATALRSHTKPENPLSYRSIDESIPNLVNPRAGPPVRLCQSATHNPRSWKIRYQNPDDYKEHFKDMEDWRNTHDGQPPPILFGKWFSDPKKRPQVELTGFGRNGQLWWEDEEGNRVPGPDEAPEWREEGWFSELPPDIFRDKDFGTDQGKTGFAKSVVGTSKTGDGVNWSGPGPDEVDKQRTWKNKVMFGDWEGDAEADVPSEFVLT